MFESFAAKATAERIRSHDQLGSEGAMYELLLSIGKKSNCMVCLRVDSLELPEDSFAYSCQPLRDNNLYDEFLNCWVCVKQF